MPPTPLIPCPPDDSNLLRIAGQTANQIAAQAVLLEYRHRKAPHTIRRQDADLELFRQFLSEIGLAVGDFADDPAAWQGITWGLVSGFVKWQLKKGYAVSSVNIRLSTIKTYGKLAMQAGFLDPKEHALIKAVQGYSHKEGLRLDQERPHSRVGVKKPEAIPITLEQACDLKTQPDTPQGRRDALLMCLLLDHGLRVGEVARLMVADIDFKQSLLKFNRPKVHKVQTHRLSADARSSLDACKKAGELISLGPLLRGSKKNSALTGAGMTERAMTKRVRLLGERAGIAGLSAHDCRHYWASTAAQKGTDPFALQEAGGWSSLAMPRRYVENAKIANDGVKLE